MYFKPYLWIICFWIKYADLNYIVVFVLGETLELKYQGV